MKSLLNVAAGETATPNPGEKEVAGEILAIRGGRPLTGRVEVKGAKNLVTKAMVAALLGETSSTLRDVPDISEEMSAPVIIAIHPAQPVPSSDTAQGNRKAASRSKTMNRIAIR